MEMLLLPVFNSAIIMEGFGKGLLPEWQVSSGLVCQKRPVKVGVFWWW